jgi:putative membrane protein
VHATQSDPQPTPAGERESLAAAPALAVRGVIGGALMGFANIVPGISGGAMLMLVGMYQRFIGAVAEVATLRFRPLSLVALVSVAGAAMTMILLLAGPVKDVVLTYTWQTYAVLIGMRLGIVPLIWKMAAPVSRGFWLGAAAGVLATIAVTAFRYTTDDFGAAGPQNFVVFFLAGLLGASATLLPGLDGSYILMLMGQYVPILASVDRFKNALASADAGLALAEMRVIIPVGLGVALGIGGVSLLLRWLLAKHPKPTLGVLVGILVGAVIGLWPFQESVRPSVGQTVRGVVMTEETVSAMARDDWPVKFFAPSVAQIGMALALVALGYALAMLLERMSPKREGHAIA